MANGNTDTRIVKLKFENREFERNIAKSTKSVEELKEAMDFEETSKGLDDFVKSMGQLDFSKFEANIEKLADKFTGLGNIGEYVLSRIRNTLESAARDIENFVRDISVGQISVGQSKYDEMNKAVMTIVSSEKASEEQAYKTMERIMAYTDQTSHSFNTMVGQLANLTSIGYGLDEAELLLEGIGNAATYAGQGAENAAASMSILTKSLGPESTLSYEKFLQLSQTARVITDKWRQQALEAGVAVGTLKKKNDKFYTNVKGQKSIEVTATNLENTLRYKWLTGQALSEIYKNYEFGKDADELAHPEKALDSFGKTAYLTGQRALTFVDALNAMRESVSSGWMNTFRLLFGDVTEAAEHFTNIADRVIESLEKIKEFRNGVLTYWAGSGGRDNLMRVLLGDYENEIETGAFGFMDLLDGVGRLIANSLKDFIALFMDPAQRKMANQDPEYFKKFIAGYLLFVTNEAERFMQRIRDFLNEDIQVQGGTKTRLELIHEVISGIAAILKFGYDILSGVIDFVTLIGAQLQPSFDSILEFLGKLGANIYETEQEAGDAKTVKKFFEDLAATVKPVTDGINKIVESITKFLTVIFGLDKQSNGVQQKSSKIGDILLKIADIIAKVLGPTLEFLASVINLITELISGKISFKDFGKNLSDAFKEMLKSFVDSLPQSFQGLGDWIRDLFGLWEDESQANEKSFASFLHRLFTGSFSSLGEFLSSLTSGFSLTEALNSGFGFASAYNFLNTVAGWFKGTNLYGIILAFLGVATVGSLFGLINQARRAVKIIGGFFDNVGGNLIAGATGRYQWFSEKLLDIAKAVALFAACIAIFGSMDRTSLVVGIAAMTFVLALVVGLWILLEKSTIAMSGLPQQIMMETLIVTLAGAVAAIALSISVLALALIPLSSDWKKMVTAVLGLAAILMIFGAFIVLMVKQLKTLTWGLTESDKWNHIGQLAVMLLLICGTITILSAAIGALTIALTPLALTGWGGTIRAIIAFTSIMAVFGVFIVLMLKQLDTLAFTIGGGNTWSGIGKMAAMLLTLAITMGIMSISIGALVIAITPLSLMSVGGLAKAIGGLALILVEIGAMIKFLQGISAVDKTVSLKIAGFVGFAIALAILILALKPLSTMSLAGWGQALSGLGIVLIEMAAMILFVQKMSVGDKTLSLKIAGIAGFAGALGILIYALIPLSTMSLAGWGQALSGLGIVLIEMAAMILFVQKMSVGDKTLSLKIAGIVGFAVAIAILIYALKPLSEMSPQGYQQALIGLATVLLELVVVLAIISELKPNLATAGSTLLLLIGVGAAMVLFSIAFNEVKNIPWERMIGFAASISLLLVAIAGAAALAKIGGISGMLILIAGVVLLIGAIALLAPLLAGSLSTSLSMLAGSLNYITAMFESFGTTMSGIDEESAEKGTRVIEQLKNMFDKISGFGKYTEHINAFSTALFDLSTGLEIFQGHTSTILDPSKNNGLKLIQELASVAPMIDVLAKADINNLTTTLTGLGGAMMLYAEGAKEATGIGAGETTDVTGAVELLKSISESLVQNGGFVIPTNMPDEEAIGLFGAQLAALAGALVKFEEAGKGLGTGTKEALRALDFFSDLKVKLTATEFAKDIGAAIRTFATGENAVSVDEMTEFGKNIEQLGKALNQFAASTTHIDEATGEIVPVNYDVAIEALTSFSDLESKLPKIGGIKSWWEGNQQGLNDLGGQIETLGKNLVAFAVSVKGDGTDEHPGFNAEEMQGALDVTDQMIDIMKSMNTKLPTVGGLWRTLGTVFNGRDTTLEDIGTQMGKLGEGLGDFGSKIKGKMPANTSEITTALNAVDGIISLVMHIASADKQVYSSNLNQYAESLNTFLNAFLNGLQMDNGENDFYSGLEALIEIMQWISGELDKAPEINLDNLKKFEILTQALNNLTSIDLSKTADFENVGLSIITGMANGITKNTSIITTAAQNAAIAAYNAAMDALDAHSPSKLFMDVGGYIGQGMAVGMDNSAKTISDSASGMGEVALDSARDMLGLISRIMAEGTDATPTIAPILDMTNIDAGMDAFRNSLNGYGINLDTAFSAGRAAQIGTSAYEDVEALKPDYSGIYQKMEDIGIQIQQMGREIRNMKFVLDTGAVAGGVADILDEEFGRRTFYELRS